MHPWKSFVITYWDKLDTCIFNLINPSLYTIYFPLVISEIDTISPYFIYFEVLNLPYISIICKKFKLNNIF